MGNDPAGAQDDVQEPVSGQETAAPPTAAVPTPQAPEALPAPVNDNLEDDPDAVTPEDMAKMGFVPVAQETAPPVQALANAETPLPAEPVANPPAVPAAPQPDHEHGQVRLRAKDENEARFHSMLRAGVHPRDATALVYGTAAPAAPADAAPPPPEKPPTPAADRLVAIDAEIAELRSQRRAEENRYDEDAKVRLSDEIDAKLAERQDAVAAKMREDLALEARAEQAHQAVEQSRYEALCARYPGYDKPNSKFRETCDQVARDMERLGDPVFKAAMEPGSTVDLQTVVAEIAAGRMGLSANPANRSAPAAPAAPAQTPTGIAQFNSPAAAGGAPQPPVRVKTADEEEAEENARFAQEWGRQSPSHMGTRIRVL